MKLSVPSNFQLAGRTWAVVRVGERKWYGQMDPSKCIIRLSAKCKDEEELLHTFLHELLHAVAHTMAWDGFNNNETRIDAVANLLLQAMTTAK